MTDMYAADRSLAEQHAGLLAEKLSQRSEVLLFDENLQEMGFVSDYLSLKFDASIDGTGGLNVVAPSRTWLAPDLLSRDPDKPMFVMAQTAAYRWSGVVESSTPRKDRDSPVVIDIVGNPLITRLDFVELWKSPSVPLQSQPDIAPVQSGNAVTLVKDLALANIGRIQSDEQWPIFVVPNYLPVDKSPMVAIESNMQPMGKAFLEALDGTGVSMMMWIWMPGDKPVPGGEGISRPTIMLDVVDMGSFSGWSTDVDDAIQQYYRVLSGGGFVAEWVPRAEPASSDAYENGFAGTDNADPWVDWDLDGPGIESWSMPTVYAKCATVNWTGLRGGYLTEVISNISSTQIKAAVNTAPAPTETQPPLIYDSVTDDARQAAMGALGLSEVLITENMAEDLAAALFEYRGYRYLTVSVVNGSPFVFGYHFGLGDSPSFSTSIGRFFASVTRASYEDSPTVRCRWDLTIGDGKADDAPSIKLLRRMRRNIELLQRYYTDIKAVTTDE